jgi:hypothetical protein
VRALSYLKSSLMLEPAKFSQMAGSGFSVNVGCFPTESNHNKMARSASPIVPQQADTFSAPRQARFLL